MLRSAVPKEDHRDNDTANDTANGTAKDAAVTATSATGASATGTGAPRITATKTQMRASAATERTAHLGERQRSILEFIDVTQRERGYPPSVREICEEVNLRSPATVHRHLRVLEADGWIRRDPSRPRALIVRFDWQTRVKGERRPARHVPLIGNVTAGTDVLAQQNVEELVPLPEDFTGGGELFMLAVRDDSMIDAGICDGDYVVARHQLDAENGDIENGDIENGDIVVAGINGGPAVDSQQDTANTEGTASTVKRYQRSGDVIVLEPANADHRPIIRPADEVTIYGKVVTVIRRL